VEGVKVFISYSKADTTLKGQIEERIEGAWSDTSIVGGDRWDDRIKAELRASRLVVLLLTDEFTGTISQRVPSIPCGKRKR